MRRSLFVAGLVALLLGVTALLDSRRTVAQGACPNTNCRTSTSCNFVKDVYCWFGGPEMTCRTSFCPIDHLPAGG